MQEAGDVNPRPPEPFADRLSRLRPAGAPDGEAAVLFEAGRAAARRQLAVWRSASGALAAACVGLLVIAGTPGASTPGAGPQLAGEVPQQQAEPTLQTQRPWAAATQTPPGGSVSPLAYIVFRDRVLDEGVAALPDAPPRPRNPAGVMTAGRMQEAL